MLRLLLLIGIYCWGLAVMANPDSSRPLRIVIVPFPSMMYFSDADQDIASISKIDRQQVAAQMRHNLNSNLYSKLLTFHEPMDLLSERTDSSAFFMERISQSAEYSASEPVGKNAQSGKQAKKGKTLAQFLGEDPAEQKNEELSEKEMKVVTNSVQYMNVVFADTGLFGDMNRKYHADYYVVFNQFEITTRYETCLDYANKNYRRDFIVHYSIFDANGKQVFGEVMLVPYESGENNIGKIIQDNFGIIATHISAYFANKSQ